MRTENCVINFLNEISLVYLFFSIIIYITVWMLIFSVLFLYKTEKLTLLSDWKGLKIFLNGFYVLFMTFASLAGIPPLAGFISKAFLIFILLNAKGWIYTIVFIIFNFFLLFFYLQNFRYLIGDEKIDNFLILENFFGFLNIGLINYMICLCVWNLFCIFFMEDFFFFFFLIFSFLW